MESEGETSHEAPVEIASRPWQDAFLLAGTLRSSGIEAYLDPPDPPSAFTYGDLLRRPYRVLVRRQDADEAKAIVAEVSAGGSPVVGFQVRRDDAPGGHDVASRFTAWGLEPRSWSSPPGDTFDWHDHPRHKILFCVRGSITFHGREGEDIELRPGDRLDIEARTQHAATIGPEGVECTEAFASGPSEEMA